MNLSDLSDISLYTLPGLTGPELKRVTAMNTEYPNSPVAVKNFQELCLPFVLLAGFLYFIRMLNIRMILLLKIYVRDDVLSANRVQVT